MEFVSGGNLYDAVVARRLTPAQIFALVFAVGEALARGHALGFVHRDVKPENILLDEQGSPKLTDFDLVAHRASAVANLGRRGRDGSAHGVQAGHGAATAAATSLEPSESPWEVPVSSRSASRRAPHPR